MQITPSTEINYIKVVVTGEEYLHLVYTYRVPKKKQGLWNYVFLYYRGWLTVKNHRFKYLYDKIYTICYYSGFYSSLRDKIRGNGGHIEFASKDGYH
jgi:hypothetical protein